MDSWYASPSAISDRSMSETYMVIVLVPMRTPFIAYQRILVPPPRRFLEEDNHSDQRFATTGCQIFASKVPEKSRTASSGDARVSRYDSIEQQMIGPCPRGHPSGAGQPQVRRGQRGGGGQRLSRRQAGLDEQAQLLGVH